MGQVNAGAMVTVGSDTNETIKVTITWGDQNNSATTEVLISMEGDSAAPLPGFTASMGLLALLGALTFSRKTGRDLEHEANFDSQ
jgi:phosphoribosylcarboxyaminoimidazole (NCAIR) mutase